MINGSITFLSLLLFLTSYIKMNERTIASTFPASIFLISSINGEIERVFQWDGKALEE